MWPVGTPASIHNAQSVNGVGQLLAYCGPDYEGQLPDYEDRPDEFSS